MRSVSGYPEKVGDWRNIQFLTRREHYYAHNGNWRYVTSGPYKPGKYYR